MTTTLVILGAVVIAALGIWVIVRLARAEGQTKATADALKKSIEEADEYRKNELNNDMLSDDELRAKLQRWSK